MKPEDRYTTTFRGLTVTKADGTAFFAMEDVRWHNLPYDKMLAVEQVFLNALNQLQALGVGEATAMGSDIGDKLEALQSGQPQRKK